MQPRRQPPGSRRAAVPPPPKKNNLPLILGGAGGGLLLLIILAVALSGGGKPAREKEVVVNSSKPKPPPAAPKPDVSHLEAEGKTKCAAGRDKVKSRLTPDASAPRDRVWIDLEEGLKLLNAGLAAFKKAADLAGKTYETADFEKTRKQGIHLLCTDIEKEAQVACDKGLKLIQDCESLMTGKTLGDADRQKLITDLEGGKKLIETGMGFYDRSYQVSEHMFDTTKYGQALKMTRGKLLELKK